MKKFQFKGTWEFDLKITHLAISSDLLTSSDSIKIEFEDDLSNEQEPLNSQIVAYEYLEQKLADILKTIQEHINERKISIPLTPILDKISILLSSKDGFSYYLVGSNDSFQFLVYQKEVIYMERMGNKLGSIQNALKKDGATLIGNHDFVPRKYSPGPKYNTLKPAHQKANEAFEVNLIRWKHNERFKQLVEQKEIDINGSYKNLSFLSNACFVSNNEIVSFLLEQGAATDGALHWCSYWNNNKKAIALLIEKGVNINFQNDFGCTVLHRQAHELAGLYQQKNRALNAKWETQSTDEKIKDRKATIQFLMKNGADPYIKDKMGRNAVQVGTHLTGVFAAEIEAFWSGNDRTDTIH